MGKAAKFLVEKLFTSEVSSQKPHGGMETPHLSATIDNNINKIHNKVNTEAKLHPLE